MSDLKPKQERFCDEYLKDLNGKQAAIRAGYSHAGAEVTASKLLTVPKVAARVAELKAERSRQTRVDAAWLLRRLADEAEAKISDLYDEHNRLKPVHEWPDIWQTGLVSGVESDELFEGKGEDREQVGFVKKVRFSDRIKRLELIGKHIDVAAFAENVNVNHIDGLADRLARAAARQAELEAETDEDEDDTNEGEDGEDGELGE